MVARIINNHYVQTNFKYTHLTKLVICKVTNKKSVCCVCHKISVLAHNAHFINLWHSKIMLRLQRET